MHAPDISNPEDYNHLNKMNLNQINAFLLSGLLKDIKSDKQLNDSSQPLNKVQIRDLIERTLENYNAKTQGKAIELNNIYEKLKVKSEGDFAVINNLKKKLTKKANFWIKGIVFGLLVQWGALYYITYNVGGWDLGEPIAYLYALGIETIGLLYLMRRRRAFSQRGLFDGSFSRKKAKVFSKYSTNPEIDAKVMTERIKHLKFKSEILAP